MSRRKKNAPKGYYVARVVNPGNQVIFLPAHPARTGNPAPSSGRARNPKVRYTFVPVDYDGNGSYDESVIVHGDVSHKEAIRAVANDVPGDAWLDVGRARTVPTKHEAIREGQRISSRIREIAKRVARGES